MPDVDVLVVGAGPAGLAAAAVAAEAGARTLVVDEQPIVGGQYLRPRPPARVDHPVATRFRASGAETLLAESVWHVDPAARQLRTTNHAVQFGSLVVATGAYDRPLAVAGGELPGVLTAGAAQALAKDGVRVGDAVLLAGTGPFALPVAAEVVRAGGGVAEIALTHLPWLGAGVLHAPQVVPEAVGYGPYAAAAPRRAACRLGGRAGRGRRSGGGGGAGRRAGRPAPRGGLRRSRTRLRVPAAARRGGPGGLPAAVRPTAAHLVRRRRRPVADERPRGVRRR
ncbi:MAG: FAD-dependent oxidoreductase [Streptosporangiales bacterium]|nr:FAD-dependent oxidoreductase [Streptosporangiales bacterium]